MEDSLKKVIVVEDDYLVRRSIVRTVKEIGYDVVGDVFDGSSVIDLIKKNTPDVVLMDIKLGEENGLDVANRIQEFCPTPVVIISAYDNADFLDKASKAGVGAYLMKPVDKKQLEHAIIIAIARHGDLLALRENLDQKKLLIKEIYHRVKNNLNVLQAIITLQCMNIDDQSVKQLFVDCQSRINSMQMIHEKLYMSSDLQSVNLVEYLEPLVIQVFHNYSVDRSRIAFELDITDYKMDVKNVVYLGLIINELITNALKYAFPGDRKGKISVSLVEGGDEKLVVTIKDNGVGMPEGISSQSISSLPSLGLNLVKSCVDQLNGTIEIRSAEGAEVCITLLDK